MIKLKSGQAEKICDAAFRAGQYLGEDYVAAHPEDVLRGIVAAAHVQCVADSIREADQCNYLGYSFSNNKRLIDALNYDPWPDRIASWLKQNQRESIAIGEVLVEALGRQAGNRADEIRAAAALKAAGWQRKFLSRDGRREWRYVPATAPRPSTDQDAAAAALQRAATAMREAVNMSERMTAALRQAADATREAIELSQRDARRGGAA